uniref:Histone chaperone domain-containing protein n=1 Tax=Populus trichocarpa TaxID=3694 RepID=A0A2K2BFJ8_POPTR|eukprot:XP_024449941.1 eukaryotic translation initiation factor 5B [Populus trichocarpa]
MAEEMQEQATETVKKETPDESLDIESQVKEAMLSRVSHFKKQADSLTFEGVRRLLEKDLGLDKLALDVHKRFVKQCLFECLDGAVTDNASKDSGDTVEKHVDSPKEVTESPERRDLKNNIKEPCSEDEEKMEDSPVMGLLSGQKTTKSKAKDTQANEVKEVPSEGSIKKAMMRRASYIKANSEEITMAGLRRLLEEDLKLDKFSLDPYKKFISKQLDEVLKSSQVSEPKKKTLKNNSHGKASKKVSSRESADSSDKESEEEDEEVKPKKKKIGVERKMQNSEGSKKRRRTEKETKVSANKRIKPLETAAEDNSDSEVSGNASEDNNSPSSAEKPVKKKEASTPAYGKRVEHLKSVIKSCGMSVPPSIYKKVKQAPENKREARLIKELEEILSREGLSSNPSEKEIKEVRKRKERAKELEGIDLSNIVTTSRRRSATSFVAPPKPKVPDESESDDTGDTEEDDEDGEEEDGNDGDDGDNDGDDNKGGDSPTEEADEDQDDGSH